MTAVLLNKIYFDYRKELSRCGLKESKAIDMFNSIKRAQRKITIVKTTVNLDGTTEEETTNKNGGKSDWLKQNPCMLRACKMNGITKSSELRDLIYTYWSSDYVD